MSEENTNINLKGPKGDKGPKGAKGEKGVQGEKGERGLQGEAAQGGASTPVTITDKNAKTSISGNITQITWDARRKSVTYATDDGQSMTIRI